MSASEDARAKIAQQREDERELRKVHALYRTLSASEQERIDGLARRSAELDSKDRGRIPVDLDLLPIARMHGLNTPDSCGLARAKQRFWMRIMREEYGVAIENHWRDRQERIANGEKP